MRNMDTPSSESLPPNHWIADSTTPIYRNGKLQGIFGIEDPSPNERDELMYPAFKKKQGLDSGHLE